jgi:TolA-binding protein
LKYELGRRLYLGARYDDAIASLQAAQRDPRRHVSALAYLGQSFVRKEWYREAADTFERALESELTEDRAKEIRYLLGDVLEKMGDLAKAQDNFSDVAQIDYNYRDVRERLESVRSKLDEAEKAPE